MHEKEDGRKTKTCEIERKFTLPRDSVETFEEDLRKAGFYFVSKKTFRDKYYDVKGSFQLLHNDWWLRDRDGRTELKIPLKGVERRGVTDCYEEIEVFDIIRDRICQSLEVKEDCTNLISTLPELLEAIDGFCFADITTTRRKYAMGCVTVDIDETDRGKRLGEIEIMYERGEYVEVDAEEENCRCSMQTRY